MVGKKHEDEGDAYTLWFFISLGDLHSTQVQDVAIKSVNGEDVPTWTKNEAGELKVIIGAGGAIPSTNSEEGDE